MEYCRLQNENYVNEKLIVDTDIVNDVTYMRQSTFKRVIKRFL